MRVDTLRKFRKLFGVLVAAVAVVLLIVLLGIGPVSYTHLTLPTTPYV